MKNKCKQAMDAILKGIEIRGGDGSTVVIQCLQADKKYFEQAMKDPTLQQLIDQRQVKVEIIAGDTGAFEVTKGVQTLTISMVLAAKELESLTKLSSRYWMQRLSVQADFIVANYPVYAGRSIAEYFPVEADEKAVRHHLRNLEIED